MIRLSLLLFICVLCLNPLQAWAQEQAAPAEPEAAAAETAQPDATAAEAAAPVPALDAITGATQPGAHQVVPKPANIRVLDRPNDDGTALLVVFSLLGTDATRIGVETQIDGQWLRSGLRPSLLNTTPKVSEMPEVFGWNPPNPEDRVFTVDRYMVDDGTGELQPMGYVPGTEYLVRLVVNEGEMWASFPGGTAVASEQWFNYAGLNSLLISVIFAFVITLFIFAARRNPNLFIRRIQGLEAVDEAIGRATEMGKPVLHINGLDPLSTLSTIAAVNILGRIARRVANYESDLLVPCFDPVVMTVSQEVVKNAYLEAGRPDTYREDNIYFLTDQQFSYVASVCGIMLREKPAANFLLGYFYAESLILAETGSATGAIQIAGTDALSQLPFFITTCDYTLIGEELYAASAYLSREPMLLGSLKGQDVGKGFVMAIVVLGTLFSTIGMLQGDSAGFDWEWLTHLLTPLM